MQILRTCGADHTLLNSAAQLLSHIDNRAPCTSPAADNGALARTAASSQKGRHCGSPFVLLGASHLWDEPVLKGHRSAAGAPIPSGHTYPHSAC